MALATEASTIPWVGDVGRGSSLGRMETLTAEGS
jgi:hypothetical protein